MRPSNLQKRSKTAGFLMFLHIPTFLSSDILSFDSQWKKGPFRLLKSINFDPQSLKTRYCFFHLFFCGSFFKKSLRATTSGVRIGLWNSGPETNRFANGLICSDWVVEILNTSKKVTKISPKTSSTGRIFGVQDSCDPRNSEHRLKSCNTLSIIIRRPRELSIDR